LLHLVGSSVLLYLIDDARSNKNQVYNSLSCFIWGSKTNCNTEVVRSTATLNTVLVKKIMWYLSFSFSSLNHPHLCLLYLQVLYFRFSHGEETYMVDGRITCGLGSSISEEYTACVSGGCLKMDVVCLFRTVCIPDDLLSVWKDTISVIFGLKWCHEMEWRWGLVRNTSFGSMISHSTFYSNRDFSLQHNCSSLCTALSDNVSGILSQ